MSTGLTVYETDVLIVGAGPSGCATALTLLNYSGTKVIMVERSDLDQIRVGEQVSSSIFKFFDYLKLTQDDFDSGHHMPSYSSISYWGSNHPNSHESVFSTEEPTHQLNREEFDLALLKKVFGLGGLIFPRTEIINIFRRDDDVWVIDLKHIHEGAFRILTKYLVDASGRNACVSRMLRIPIKKYDKLMGVGCFFRSAKANKHGYGHVIETCDLGWWYCAYLPNNRMVVSLFTDADIISDKRLNQIKNWQDKLSAADSILGNLGGSSLETEKLWVKNACSQILTGNFPPNFVSVGEAACSFDPVSSMGIGFALSSGCQAAVTILGSYQNFSTNFLLFQSDVRRTFNEYLTSHKKIYEREQRWPHSQFWNRRNATKELLT